MPCVPVPGLIFKILFAAAGSIFSSRRGGGSRARTTMSVRHPCVVANSMLPEDRTVRI